MVHGAGEMAERMKVTEGLGSAMLGIWLRDVQCSCTVSQHMDTGITQRCVNGRCRGQLDREHNEPTQ